MAGKTYSGAHTFVGATSVPTMAADTNSTRAASTAFVLGQAATTSPVMDGSAAVGTSSRFALADHVHPSDTSRAPLASPALTGTPTAPTAANGTNTTQIATTAFVLANGGTTALLSGTNTWTGVNTYSNSTVFNGNVGFDYASPAHPIDIRSNTQSQLHFVTDATEGGGYLLGIGTGAYLGNMAYNGSNWIAKSTSAALIGVVNDSTYFYGDSGVTSGSTPPVTIRLQIDGTGKVIFNNDATAYLYRSTTGTIASSGTFTTGGIAAVTSSRLVSIINNGNSFEFGHNNSSGYRGTLGAYAGAGNNFLAFHGEHGTNNNTFRSRGVKPSIVLADNAGGLSFGNVALDTGDNQTFISRFELTPAGDVQTRGGSYWALGSSGHGYVAMRPGTSTTSGHFAWYTPNGTRQGYMGDNTNNTGVKLVLEQGSFAISGAGLTAAAGRVWTASDSSGNGTWSDVPATQGTELGGVEITSDQTTSSTTQVDVPGSTATITVGSRPIQVFFGCALATNTSANQTGIIYLWEQSPAGTGTWTEVSQLMLGASNTVMTWLGCGTNVARRPAGIGGNESRAYKLRYIAYTGGTLSLRGGPSYPIYWYAVTR